MARFEKKLPAPPRPPRPDEGYDKHASSSQSSDTSYLDTIQEEAEVDRQVLRENETLRLRIQSLQKYIRNLEQAKVDRDKSIRLLREQNAHALRRLDRQNESLRALVTTVQVAFSNYLGVLDVGGEADDGLSGAEGDEVLVYGRGLEDPPCQGVSF
ncbi:hypothetical protein JX265_014116, partial [Neoarthrinium moseri]